MKRFDSPTIRSHSVAWLGAHLVWCTGARGRWIDAAMDAVLEHVFLWKTRELDAVVLAAGSAPGRPAR